MQEPASVSDLFQQINSLRNEMELARQSNQEEAAEYEKDMKEIEHLKQKEEHLRVKNDEKVRKKMAVEVQLQTKRTLLSFTRQRLDVLTASNDALRVDLASMKNNLEEERSQVRSELLVKTAEDQTTFQLELEKLNEEVRSLEVSLEKLQASVSSLEAKCNHARDARESLEQQRVQLEDTHARNAEMELRRVALQNADQEIAALTESLRSQLTEKTVTWKQLSKDLDIAKDEYSYFVDLNSSLRVHYDKVKHQVPLPRKRAANFVYDV